MAAKRTYTFIVRIWEEPREIKNEARIWRGSVERVSDRLRIHFDRFSSLRAFISGSAGFDLEDGEKPKP